MHTLPVLPLSRRTFLGRVGRVAGGATLAACVSGTFPVVPASAGDASTLTVAVAQPHSIAHLPLLLAHTLGYFQAEGLQVELSPHATEDRAVQAVLRGHAAVVACTYARALQQHARGGEWQSFLLQLRAPQVVLGVSTKTLRHYRTPADLRGRRVGVLASVAPGQMVLGAVLQSAGFKPSDALLVVADSSDELLARYQAGELDALSVNDPMVTWLEQRGEIRVLADTRSVHGTRALLGGPVPGGAMCAPLAWLSAFPEECQSLANGLVRALKWLQTAGPTDLIKALPEAAMGPDRGVYLSAFDKARGAFSPDGLLSADAAAAALTAYARLDPALLGLGLNTLSQTYTNQFALKAKARFRA